MFWKNFLLTIGDLEHEEWVHQDVLINRTHLHAHQGWKCRVLEFIIPESSIVNLPNHMQGRVASLKAFEKPMGAACWINLVWLDSDCMNHRF